MKASEYIAYLLCEASKSSCVRSSKVLQISRKRQGDFALFINSITSYSSKLNNNSFTTLRNSYVNSIKSFGLFLYWIGQKTFKYLLSN